MVTNTLDSIHSISYLVYQSRQHQTSNNIRRRTSTVPSAFPGVSPREDASTGIPNLLMSPPRRNIANLPGSQTMPECSFNKSSATLPNVASINPTQHQSKNRINTKSKHQQQRSTESGRLGGAVGLLPPRCVGPGFPLRGWFCPSGAKVDSKQTPSQGGFVLTKNYPQPFNCWKTFAGMNSPQPKA